MNGWKEKEHSIELKEAVSHTFTYVYEGTKVMVSASASCGCSTPNILGNILKVTYSGCSVPFTQKAKGFTNVSKTVTVLFDDDTSDVLTFRVKCLSS